MIRGITTNEVRFIIAYRDEGGRQNDLCMSVRLDQKVSRMLLPLPDLYVAINESLGFCEGNEQTLSDIH